MKYCENCHVAAEPPRCPLCGGKRLREVKDEDYCFLTEMRAMEGEMLADILRGTKHFGDGSCGTLRTEDTQDVAKL